MSARDRRTMIGAVIAASVGAFLMSLAGLHAAYAAQESVAPAPATLTVVGEPLIGVFTPSSTTSVEAEWAVSAVSPAALDADGVFVLTTDAGGEFARDLRVAYGAMGAGGDLAWHDAGTLGAPLSYTAAVGQALVVHPGEATTVRVRVSYEGDWSWAHSTADRREIEARFQLTAPAPFFDDHRDRLPNSGGSLYETGVLAALFVGLLFLTLGVWWWGAAARRRAADERDAERS